MSGPPLLFLLLFFVLPSLIMVVASLPLARRVRRPRAARRARAGRGGGTHARELPGLLRRLDLRRRSSPSPSACAALTTLICLAAWPTRWRC
ncbi:MAG: hypothetical protein MZV65_44260 [Chromatiales bacterium]|nr:hypothetical protein [Chromatiales bacterium]